MYHLDIQSKIEILPENAQQTFADFVDFLLSRYYKPLKKQFSGESYAAPSCTVYY